MLPLAGRFDDRDVVLIDLRGHGNSDAPRFGYVPRALAGDVTSLCRRYDRPVLYGHSLGSEAVARAARRDSVTPAGVILSDPPAKLLADVSAPDRVEMAARDVRRWQRSSHGQIREEYADRDNAETLATARKQFSPEAVGFSKWEYTPVEELVEGIDCPVLILRPDPSAVDYIDPGEEVGDESVVVEHVENATHTISRDCPAATERIVRRFLEERC